MAQWIAVLAYRPEDLSLTPDTTGQQEGTNPQKLSFDLDTHALFKMHTYADPQKIFKGEIELKNN